MSVNYPLGTITPNLGLSLIGQDEVIAENFILIDNFASGGGGGALGISGGNTAGTTGSSTGVIYLQGGSNITLSGNNSTIVIQGGAGSGGGGIAASLSGNTSGALALISSGTLILAGGNNITLSQNGQSVTISGPTTTSQSVQTQGSVLINGSSGSIVLTAGNNVTLSQNASTITISAANQTVQTQNLVSINGSTGAIVFTAGNNITLSQNASTITISAFNQSVQTQNLVDVSLAGNTSGTLTVVSSGTLILAGGNNITLSQNGQNVTISGPNTAAQSIQTQNMVSINGSTGAIVFTAGNNITLSQNASTITISAFNQSAQTQNCVDLSLGGNTSGTLTLINSGTALLVGGNNITLSQNGQSITISGANATASNAVNVSLGGNTTGTLTLISTGTMVLAGGNNITLSQNGQSVTISAANSGASVTNSQYVLLNANPMMGSTLLPSAAGTLFVWPFQCQGYISATQIDIPVQLSLNTGAAVSMSGTIAFNFGISTRNVSTLSSLSSVGATFQFTNVSNNSTTGLSGQRNFSAAMNMNMTPGDYFLGILCVSTSAGVNSMTLNQMMGNIAGANFSGYFGVATNKSVQVQPGLGQLSVSTAAMPITVGMADISANGALRYGYAIAVNYTV